MASDSDDDFERFEGHAFLQEEDSASMSSASPVKPKSSKDLSKTKKAKAASSTAAPKAKASASSKAYSAGSSLSVVAAAERLLAASGRAKKHAPVVEAAAEDDDDEPPPSYSDDPYAFDLGDNTTSRISQKSDEDEDEDDERAASRHRTSSRRSSKSKKGKVDRDASVKSTKTKSKSKDKETTATKGEAKSAKTLEDRIADILKRTGSTTYPTGSVPAEDKNRDDDDEKEDSDDYEKDIESAEPKKNGKSTVSLPTGSSQREVDTEKQNKRSSEDDEDSQSHRLSFSDSLGMDSADFEVGAFAKRKLDRSRLSLAGLMRINVTLISLVLITGTITYVQSSLNSEKFAVNLEALEESELASRNRYDQQNEEIGRSIDASEAAGSDYDDDGFELDQTTDANTEKPGVETDTVPPGGTSLNNSFVSQFESMKSLFSLESPIKHADSSNDVQRVAAFIQTPNVRSEPPDSDNFGYDDEDFEVDEVTPISDQSAVGGEGTLTKPTEEADGYGDETFQDGDEKQVVSISREPSPRMDLQQNDSNEQNRHLPDNTFSNQGVTQTQSPFQFEVISTVVSVTETRVGSTGDTNEVVVTGTPTIAPSPPKSPPPPPPPDDDQEEDHSTPSASSAKTSPAPTVLPATLAPPAPSVTDASSPPDRSVQRFRAIEQQVSSLRFVPESSRVVRSISGRLREEEPVLVIDDPNTLQEIREIEQLVEQAKRARHGRRKSASIRSSVKENELALRLQQAQRQLLQFKQHVKDLAESDGESPSPLEENSHHSSDRDSDRQDLHLPGKRRVDDKSSRKEIEDLKREVHSQERLIQGFQKENEQLMKQLKQLRRDLQYDAHKENESLRIQLKDLRTHLDGAPIMNSTSEGIEGKIQYRAAIEARLQAEARAEALQDELKSQARRHQDRVNELKIELERVKKAKIDLECRYEGINLEKMEAESQQIKLLKEQLEIQRAEHDHSVNAMQKKIDWYVKNQRLLDEQDEQMSELKAENKRLKGELAASTTNTPASAGIGGRSPRTPAKGGTRHASDIRRIQELESRLSDMEEAMRRRHPDSLVSLMVASRKADEESKLNEMIEKHEREVAELMDEMERLEASHERKLNAFRQQHEKIVLQYQKQVAELERQLKTYENTRGGSMTQVKAQKKATGADDDELYRVRRFYAEKIKEVERKWEAKYRAVKKQHYAASGPFADDSIPEQGEASPADAARVIRSLHKKISSQEADIRKLQANTLSTGVNSGDLRRRISSLEMQLKTSEDARRHLIETISTLNSMAPSSGLSEVKSQRYVYDERRREQELEARLISEKHEYEQTLARYREQIEKLEHQVADESTARQELVNTIAGNIREVERLQKLLEEAEREKRQLQQSADRVAALESEVTLLREQASVPQTPSMLQFRSLELRIETLTQKHQMREAELKMLLAQATQSSQLEKLNFDRMYRNAIALKNAEINNFKKQLGEILDELEALRRAPPSPP